MKVTAARFRPVDSLMRSVAAAGPDFLGCQWPTPFRSQIQLWFHSQLETGCGQSARPAECLLCAAIEPSGSALIRLTAAARRTDLRCSIDARSDFCLLRDLQGVIHLDAQVSDGRLELRMAEQQLHRTKVSRPPVDQRSLRPPHRVSSVIGRI